jgi:crotonobetainyl-CoA:carnitine CoA-transferase CaiB-like acyl-CoA transferase
MLPLDGIKVIDLTQNVAGPYASMILAEMGAEVIKVEPPNGDATRTWGPPFWEGISPTFLAINRNKKAITINIKDEKEREQLIKEIKDADVFLVSSRPGIMGKYGLDFESLMEINSQLIYGEVTAFGKNGPKKDEPGYDPLMQAMCGIMSVTGNEGEAPVRVGTSIIDMATGMWLATGILGALQLRERTGHGHLVTSSLFETAIKWMSHHFVGYWGSGELPGRFGSGNPMICPYEAFPTCDKWVVIAAGNDSLFKKLCQAFNRNEWVNDERFINNSRRVENRLELINLIGDITQSKTSETLLQLLKDYGIPAAPVLNVDEILKEEQLLESGMIQTINHSHIPDFKSIGLPLVLDNMRPPLRYPPPIEMHDKVDS